MHVIGLDNKQYKWDLTGYVPANDSTRPRSELHLNVRNRLKSLYSTDLILEEVKLPDCNLYLDFFLPKRKLAIECQGEQHFTYNSFFFKNKADFIKAKNRDHKKQEWCRLNSIQLIIITSKDKLTEIIQ